MVSQVFLPLPVNSDELGLTPLSADRLNDPVFDCAAYYEAGLVDITAQMRSLTRDFKAQFVRPWTLYLVMYRRDRKHLLAWRHGENNAKVRLTHPLAQAHLESLSRSAQSLHYDFERSRLHLNACATLLSQLQQFCLSRHPVK